MKETSRYETSHPNINIDLSGLMKKPIWILHTKYTGHICIRIKASRYHSRNILDTSRYDIKHPDITHKTLDASKYDFKASRYYKGHPDVTHINQLSHLNMHIGHPDMHIGHPNVTHKKISSHSDSF